VNPTRKKRRKLPAASPAHPTNIGSFRNARRNWNEERRVNAETFGLNYRPMQQGNNNNQRSGYRRNNGRYQRNGNGNGNSNGGYGNRNAMYYGNFNSRVRAY
jgi:hypothetical protein